MASDKATMLFSELSSPSDITVRYRYDGGYFDLRRLKAKTKVLEALMRDFLFADDCVVAALNETDFQELASCMSIATKAFWLPPQPNIEIDGTKAQQRGVLPVPGEHSDFNWPHGQRSV